MCRVLFQKIDRIAALRNGICIASDSGEFLYTVIGTALRKGRRLDLLYFGYRMSGGVALLTLRKIGKEALMTDFELLSLVIAIISLAVIVVKK